MKSLLVSSAVIGGAGAVILDIPKVYENVLSVIVGNDPEEGFQPRRFIFQTYGINKSEIDGMSVGGPDGPD